MKININSKEDVLIPRNRGVCRILTPPNIHQANLGSGKISENFTLNLAIKPCD